VLFRTSSHSGGNSVASYGDRCCAGLRVGRRDQTAAPGDSQDCGVMCWVGAETGPAGASDREDLERQIAFQKAAIQAIALTGRFGEMPAAPHRLHQLEASCKGCGGGAAQGGARHGGLRQLGSHQRRGSGPVRLCRAGRVRRRSEPEEQTRIGRHRMFRISRQPEGQVVRLP
jgi:hypothetical protein